MTNGRERTELLGSPLPGNVWLRHWRVTIERRGNWPALVWRVANSPAIATKTKFLSVPGPQSEAALKRGLERLKWRLKHPDFKEPHSLEELAAAFRRKGGQVQSFRGRMHGAPPFFSGAGVLDDFVLLAEGPDETIRAFAAHWGPLGICKHLLPWTHSLTHRWPMPLQAICLPLGAHRGQGLQGWEPLSKWRDYAREAKSITLDALTLRNRHQRRYDELDHLFKRAALWLEHAAVSVAASPELDTSRPWPCGFQATFAITNVFQILALQLLGVVAGGRELASCSHCGFPFMLTGHREGKRTFCRSCVDRKIPVRYAARAYRARESRLNDRSKN